MYYTIVCSCACACVCVCVCMWEKETERERGKRERGRERTRARMHVCAWVCDDASFLWGWRIGKVRHVTYRFWRVIVPAIGTALANQALKKRKFGLKPVSKHDMFGLLFYFLSLYIYIRCRKSNEIRSVSAGITLLRPRCPGAEGLKRKQQLEQ